MRSTTLLWKPNLSIALIRSSAVIVLLCSSWHWWLASLVIKLMKSTAHSTINSLHSLLVFASGGRTRRMILCTFERGRSRVRSRASERLCTSRGCTSFSIPGEELPPSHDGLESNNTAKKKIVTIINSIILM